MKVLLLCVFISFSALSRGDFLFVEASFTPDEKWTEFSKQDDLNVKNLVQHLSKSPSGRELLKAAKAKASRYGQTLSDVIKPGSGSLTDTTLIRKFSPHNPEHIVYETRSVVFINRNLNQYDALLDLAHELTHYVYRGDFNPYKAGFSLSDFIKNTIEGKGGEAQAFVRECHVLKELFPERHNHRHNCAKVTDPGTGKVSKEKAISRFYQVGRFEDAFKRLLMKEGALKDFPELNSEEISFVSSAYGVPYPVAAYKEYKAVMSKVCENDKRRLAYLKRSSAAGRSPASDFASTWEQRCAKFD